jgi:hypothetical protein
LTSSKIYNFLAVFQKDERLQISYTYLKLHKSCPGTNYIKYGYMGEGGNAKWKMDSKYELRFIKIKDNGV